ncbi:hypothetical protein JKF63_05429 [Porcisia hertigi]|uniref:Uncharacterized protein n=1 Tax=Porcisia hertigi TaxID=2761500 RepID=A0A836LDM0_9TRYP|nr:hypothetical protein JKF63_05429 [Porcisia hertigi]
MHRLEHIHSDSDFHCDEESSQSMSQVRARPAIRLDTSLSFTSTTSMLPGTVSGPASPLLAALTGESSNDRCRSCAAPASPPSLFQTRDLNVEVSQQQRSLQSLKVSHSRAVSDTRSAHHSSSRPYSQQQQQLLHQPHRILPPPPSSSTSPPVSNNYRARREPPRGNQKHFFAVGAGCDALDVLESEATVLTLPSDPKPYGQDTDGESMVCSQRVVSVTVSPAPRHAVTLSDDFEGDFSMPVSVGAEPRDEEASRDRGSRNAARAIGYEREASDPKVGEEEEDDGHDGNSRRSVTPPPRHAFVLSRRHSSADRGSDVCAADAPLPQFAAEEAEECAFTTMPPPLGFGAGAARESTVLVMDKSDEDEPCVLTDNHTEHAIIARMHDDSLASVDARLAVSPRHSADCLFPGIVVRETEENVLHSADLTRYPVTVAGSGSLSSHSGCRRSGSSSMMSPMPRPVMHSAHATATSKRSSPAHAREDEDEVEAVHPACEEAEGAPEQQRTNMNAVLVGKAGNVPVRTTTATATTVTSTTENTVSFSMYSSTLPAISSVEGQLQTTRAISAQPDATEALTPVADSDLASVTPLNSFMMPNSMSGPSLTVATTATSSLWLVSGSTPTPLRRLRDRDKEMSVTLDAQAGEGDKVNATSDAARAPLGPSLKLVEKANTTAVVLPPLNTESHRDIDKSSTTAGNSIEPLQRIPGSCESHHRCRSSPPRYTTGHHDAILAVSAPSFSPEPARPQAGVHSLSSPPPATRAVASVSIDLDPLPLKKDDMAEPLVPRSPRAPEEATTEYGYSTATPPPSSVAAQTPRSAVDTVPWMSSPSSAESRRVSEEVKGLVKRARAEVCRTRESLLSTLRGHRSSFHLSETSPTPKCAPSAAAQTPLAQSTTEVLTSMCASASAPPTPTRSLVLPTVAMTAAEPSTSPSAALTTISASATRSSGERRSAAILLRPQLRAAADAILRRLQGYDVRDHGVLPMETIMRVTYFVITRQQAPFTTCSLRTADGALAATPMRTSMLASGGTVTSRSENTQLISLNVEGCHAAVLSGTPLGAQLSASDEDGSRRRIVTAPLHAIDTPLSCACPLDRTRPRVSGAYETAADEEGVPTRVPCRGRPATCISPSRTLERVMLLQQRRAEEELYLEFYFSVLEAFKLVFGERYAWRHLGATNASRHECVIDLSHPAQKRRRIGDGMISGIHDRRGHATLKTEEFVPEQRNLDVVNELNDVTGPLETLFPRLRQQYASLQREKRHADGTAKASLTRSADDILEVPTATADPLRSEAAAGATDLAHRPPPLDMLVYYRTFVKSLMDL